MFMLIGVGKGREPTNTRWQTYQYGKSGEGLLHSTLPFHLPIRNTVFSYSLRGEESIGILDAVDTGVDAFDGFLSVWEPMHTL